MLICLDTNVVIYFIERPPTWGPRAGNYVAAALANKDKLAVSYLSRLECHVDPLAQNDVFLLTQYESFFHSPDVQLLQLTVPVCDKAAELRAKYRFKLGDALCLASAIVHGCDRFVTNDRRLSACTDITIELLP